MIESMVEVVAQAFVGGFIHSRRGQETDEKPQVDVGFRAPL